MSEFGAAWSNWDALRGRKVAHFDMPGLSDTTMTPRKYGFQARLKPPFRMLAGRSVDDLEKRGA